MIMVSLISGLHAAIAAIAVLAFRECMIRVEPKRQGQWHKRGAMAFYAGFIVSFVPPIFDARSEIVNIGTAAGLGLFLFGVAAHWIARADPEHCLKVAGSIVAMTILIIVFTGVFV
jgi:hypothetical protein